MADSLSQTTAKQEPGRPRLRFRVSARRLRTLGNRFVFLTLIMSLVATVTFGRGSLALFSDSQPQSGTFTTADSFGGCPAGTAAPVFLTGLEHGAISSTGSGLFNSISSTGGAPVTDAAVKRNGSYSLKIAKSAAGNSFVQKNLTGAVAVARVAVRFASLPTGNVEVLAVGNAAKLSYNPASNRLEAYFGTNARTTGSTPIVAGTWHVVDLRVNVGTNPRTIHWQVDAIPQAGVVSYEPAISSVSSIRFGSATTADVFTVNYDDIIVSSTSADYPLADGKVLASRPDGMGTHAGAGNFTNDDGTAIAATSNLRVDDNPMTSTGDYVQQGTISATSYLEVTFADTTESCFNGVSAVVAYHSSASSQVVTAKTSVMDGSTESVIHSGTMVSTTLTYRSVAVSRASAWTASAVNGLTARLGFRSSGDVAPQWDALLLEYDVRLAASLQDTSSPAAPTLAGSATDGANTLTWSTAIDPTTPVTYQLYRGGTLVFSGSATSYTDGGLTNGTSYSYTVRATDAAGNQSSPSNTRTLTPSASVGCPPSVTPVWLSGMEHGRAITTGGGVFNTGTSLAADSSLARNGLYSLSVAASGASRTAGRILTPSRVTVARFAIRFEALPTADVAELAGAYTIAGAPNLQLQYKAASGKLALFFTGGTATEASTSLQPGAWYLIDLRVDTSQATYRADWRIDGVAQPQASVPGTAADLERFMWGTSFADTYTAYYDDLMLSQTSADYPIGDGRVLSLVPDGAGTHSGSFRFLNDGGTAIDANTHTRLDERPMNATSDSVSQQAASSSSYLDFTFENTAESCIRGVAAYVATSFSGSSAANHARTTIRDGAVERVVHDGETNVSGINLRSAIVTPGSGAWTQSALNGLVARIGQSVDVSPIPTWQALMLEYAVPAGSSGADATAPTPPMLTGAAGNAVATMSWTPVSDRSTPITYQLFRGATQVFSGTATSYTDTGLTNGTTYTYTVRATDAAGNQSSPSDAVNVTPRTGDTTAPSAPTLSGTAGNTQNSLSWTTVTDPSTPVSYQLFRDGTQVFSGTATSYTDTGLTNGTAYTYTVRARDAASNQSAASNTLTLVAAAPPIAFVKNIGTASCGTTSSSVIVPTGGAALRNTLIVRWTGRGTTAGSVSVSDSRGNSYTVDRDVLNGDVRSVVVSGHIATALAANDTITITHPSLPASTVAIAEFTGIAGAPRVDVSASATGTGWSPTISATTTNAYDLLIGGVANGPDSTTMSQPFGWTGLASVATNCGGQTGRSASHGGFRIVGSTGSQTYSPTLGVSDIWSGALVAYRAAGPDTVAPAAPTLSGTAGDRQNSLSWTTVTDPATPITYKVYRGGVEILSTTSASFTDSGLANGASYSYTVRASDAVGNQSVSSNTVTLSPTATADTTAPSAPTLSGTDGNGQNTLSWTSVTDPSTPVTYQLFRGATQVFSGTATTYVDTGLTNGTSYSYTVRASDAANNQSVASNTLSFTPSAACSYRDAVMGTAGLVAYWRLGEASGTNAAEQKGSFPGTYTNVPTLGVPSLLACSTNTAVKLDGTNHYVSVADNFSLRFSSNFALEAWVKLDALPSGSDFNIIAKSGSYWLGVDDATDKWQLGFTSGANSPTVLSAEAAVVGQTYHLVGTYDGGNLRLYVNGVLSGLGVATGSVTATTNALRLGTWDGATEFANGTIDEVAVYNSALAETVVQDHYNKGFPADTSAPSAPNLSGTAGNAQNSLSWTAVSDPTAPVSYQLFRGATEIYSGGGTSFTDTGLTNGTTYSYTVKATDGAANQSAASNTVTLTPVAPDSTAPSPPALSGTAGDAQASLTWTTVSDPSAPVSYQLFRGVTKIYDGTGTSFTDTGLTNGTAYTYTVKATDAASNQSTGSNAVTLTPAGFGGGVTCPTSPSAAWLTGVEYGRALVPDLFQGLSNATADSTVARSGSWSLKIAKGSGQLGYAYRTLSSSHQVVHFAMRLASLPAGDVTLASISHSGSHLLLKYQSSTQKLGLQWGTQAPAMSSSTVVAGQWYVIDIKADTSANPIAAEWKLDGASQGSTSSAEANGLMGRVTWGSTTTNTTDVFTANYDDILVSHTPTDYPIPDLEMLALRISGQGIHTNASHFQNNDGTPIDASSHTRLDDADMVMLEDYVRQVTPSSTSYLEFTFEDTTEPCVSGAFAITDIGRTGSQAAHSKTSIFDGTTERVVFDGDPPCGSCAAERSAVLPSVNAGWTQAEINGLVARLGYSTDADPAPFWDSLMIEYAALPAVAADTTAPSAPTLSGTAGNAQNSLSWSTVSDPSTPVSYQLFRGGTKIYDGTDTSFTDTGLTNGTSYSYTVKATDGAANQSGASNTVTLTPVAPDTTAPAAPTLSGTAGDAANALSWTAVSDPSTPVSYQLFRGGTKIYDGTNTSFSDTGLTNGTSYSYTVKAKDAAANQSGDSNTVTLTPAAADTTAPSAPTLSGTAGNAQNSLSWTAVSDPSTPVTYQLFRGSTKIYDGTDTSFTDTGLTNGASYSYTVRTTDGAANQSVASNTVTLTPVAPDTTAPSAPNLSGTAGDAQNSLSWTAVSDPSTPVTYQLFRGSTKVYDGTNTSFTDTGLTNGTSYSYTVRAKDGPGNQSTDSNTVTLTPVTTWSCPTTPPSMTWITGMEHGLSTTSGGGIWNVATGSVVNVDGSVKRSGAYSLRVTASGGVVFRGRVYASAANSWVARFAIRLDSLPAADVTDLAGLTTINNGGSSTPYLSLRYKASTQKLAIGFPGQTIEADTTVSAGVWYVVDMRLDASSNPHRASWRIDGVAQAGTTNAVAADTVYLAYWGSMSASTFVANYDDIALSHTAADYPLGNGRVLALRPDGMGASVGSANFQNDDGTAIDANTWTRLDDATTGSNIDFVKQVTTSDTSYLEMTLEDTTETCIRGVAGRMVFDPLNVNQTNHGKTVVLDGSTERTVYDGGMTVNQSTNMQPKVAMIAPAGSSWTRAAVNALRSRIGYSTDAAPNPQWHSVLVEYEFAIP